MNEITTILNEKLRSNPSHNDFDVIGIIPIPTHTDRMVQLRSLQEIFEEFEGADHHETLVYLLQLKPKNPNDSPQAKAESNSQKSSAESVYLPDGKLNVPYLIKNADLLFEAGDYPLAKNICKTILKSGEFTASTLYRLARCLEAEGRIDEACAHYEESITYQPTLESYQKLANLLIRQGKHQHAAEVMERALNLRDIEQSLRFELYKAIGNCWTRMQKPDKAEKSFKKALEVCPSADDVRSNLGALCLQNRQTHEAKRHFRDAVAANPRNHHALAGLGTCFLEEGDKNTAHDYFAQALQIELNNPTAIFYIAKCAYELKSYATAAKFLEEYVQIAPVNANLLYSLAGLQFHLGRISDARSTTLRILELQSQHTGAKELLERVERYIGSSE